MNKWEMSVLLRDIAVKPRLIFRFGTSETKKMVALKNRKLGRKNVLRQTMKHVIADVQMLRHWENIQNKCSAGKCQKWGNIYYFIFRNYEKILNIT